MIRRDGESVTLCASCTHVSTKYTFNHVKKQQEKYAKDIIQPTDPRFEKLYPGKTAKAIQAHNDVATVEANRAKPLPDVTL